MCAVVAGVCRATWDGEGASRVLTDYESASLNAIAMDFNQPRIICLGEGFQIEGIFKSHFHRKPKSAHMTFSFHWSTFTVRIALVFDAREPHTYQRAIFKHK